MDPSGIPDPEILERTEPFRQKLRLVRQAIVCWERELAIAEMVGRNLTMDAGHTRKMAALDRTVHRWHKALDECRRREATLRLILSRYPPPYREPPDNRPALVPGRKSFREHLRKIFRRIRDG